MRTSNRTVVLLLSLLLSAPAAAARPAGESPVETDLWVDIPLLATSVALWLGPQPLVPHALNVSICDPCDPSTLNSLDKHVINYESRFANVASDVTSIVIPLAALSSSFLSFREFGWRGFGEDVLMLAQSVAAAGALQQLTRIAVRRPRPFLYVAGKRPDERGEGAATMSFYSGHTSLAYAVASTAAYLYHVRNPESRWRWLVWVAALSLATLMPVLRVASGEHFYTDVVVGAVVGTGIGIAVPALHRRKERYFSMNLSAGGGCLGVGGLF